MHRSLIKESDLSWNKIISRSFFFGRSFSPSFWRHFVFVLYCAAVIVFYLFLLLFIRKIRHFAIIFSANEKSSQKNLYIYSIPFNISFCWIFFCENENGVYHLLIERLNSANTIEMQTAIEKHDGTQPMAIVKSIIR